MELSLKNIGLVENSKFELSGLTILTGANDCGKTTVGKVLYCLLESFYNIDNKYKNARKDYVSNKIDEIMSAFFRPQYFYDRRPIYRFYKDIESGLINDGYSMSAVKEYVESISEKEFIREFLGKGGEDIGDSKKHELYLSWMQKAKEICQTADNLLCAEDAFYGYIEDTLNNYLNIIFKSQVKSIKYNRQTAEIKLCCEDYKVNLRTNNGSHFKLNLDGFNQSTYKKCIFIDNPYILDSLRARPMFSRPVREVLDENNDGLASTNRYLLPYLDLLRLLYAKTDKNNYFEDKENALKLNNIVNLVNKVLPGEFTSNDKGFFYVSNNTKLNISNLATGSKMFSIIKMLIINGKIDKNTFLVLDEPESHLHPEWINKLAEILVVLSKDVGVQILLTTHSPNFLMAIEAFTKKYNTQETTHFYHAVKKEDNYRVEYKEITDCRHIAYASFTNPLIEVKTLKDE